MLDPISLLSSKTYMALRVKQKQRRDAQHMFIMLVCVRAFLRNVLRSIESGELPERAWLNAIERVLKLAESSVGRKAVKKFGVDWTQALPLLEIGASSHRAAAQIRTKRLPQWAAKMRRG